MKAKILVSDLKKIRGILSKYLNDNIDIPPADKAKLAMVISKLDACIKAIEEDGDDGLPSGRALFRDIASSLLKYCSKETIEMIFDTIKQL